MKVVWQLMGLGSMESGGGISNGTHELSVHEHEDEWLLLSIIHAVHPEANQPYLWRWRFDKFHNFSVKTCYDFLSSFSIKVGLDHETQGATNDIWQLAIPMKVGVFG